MLREFVGETEVFRENPPPCHFVYQKSHFNWLGVEPEQPRREASGYDWNSLPAGILASFPCKLNTSRKKVREAFSYKRRGFRRGLIRNK
jgi:hypothetical protein